MRQYGYDRSDRYYGRLSRPTTYRTKTIYFKSSGEMETYGVNSVWRIPSVHSFIVLYDEHH